MTYEAAKLKGRYKIAYADCFAAALSHRLNAVIVTGDLEFKKLGDEYSIQWLKPKSPVLTPRFDNSSGRIKKP